MHYANRKLKSPIINVFFYNKTHGFAVLPIVRICIVLKKYYCMQTKFLNLPATQAIKVLKANI